MAFEWGNQHGLSACSGAEVHLLGDGTFAIRVMYLSLHKSHIQIDRKKEYTVSLEQLASIELNGPIALTLTGKGVLIKKTAKLESVTEQSLRQLFPGFKLAEFYVQHFSSGDHSFIALIRQEIADPILKAIRKHGGKILVFSLGPFAAAQVMPLLNHYGTHLDFDGHQVILDEQKNWLDYSYTTGAGTAFQLKLGIEPIPQQYLLAYASAFQLILNERLDLVGVGDQQMEEELAELLSKLKFKKNSALSLYSLFALLLVNFLLFSYYNAANQKLAGKAGRQNTQTFDRKKLETAVIEKEKQVNLLGWNHGQHYSFLCDQIGQTVPAAITLNELHINRLAATPITSDKEVQVETGTIKILGQSASIYAINEWIYALKQKPWVKTVQLQKYTVDQQQDLPVFTIRLNY